jgi:hypothetical protein
MKKINVLEICQYSFDFIAGKIEKLTSAKLLGFKE